MGPAMREVILLACVLFADYLFLRWAVSVLDPTPKLPFREPDCPRCGTQTVHYCGMGACVQMCPKCDALGARKYD